MAFEEHIKRARHDGPKYLDMIRKLLPFGSIWGFHIDGQDDVVYDSFGPDLEWEDDVSAGTVTNDDIGAGYAYASSILGRLFSVFSNELARLEARAYDLVNESVAGNANELLPEYMEQTIRDATEQELVEGDDDAKRALAHGKTYDEAVVADDDFFINYALTLGFVVTVDENPTASTPFICSIDHAQDEARCAAKKSVTGHDLGPHAYRMGGRGAFSIIEITVAPGGTGVLDLMFRLFDKAKPAHVVIVWKGAITDQGNWNATTNTPALSNGGGGGVDGDFYIVSVAGSTSIDGESSWLVGDYIVHDGALWYKVAG